MRQLVVPPSTSKPPMSQAEFARLLREAMKRAGLGTSELAARLGRHETTISRWRSPDYADGPPGPTALRAIERALNLPAGYFGDASATLVPSASPSPGGEVGAAADAGWLWGHAEDAERRFRAQLRALERELRVMANAKVAEDYLRRLRLDVVELSIKQAELAGRAVPEFLPRILIEVSSGTFQ